MIFLKTTLLAIIVLLSGGEVVDGLKVGDQAIDFNLKNIDGKMVSLSGDKEAKGYILIFTCNTCPYSVMYEDRIIALHKKYAAKGYPVVAVQPNNAKRSPGDSYPKMQQRAKSKEVPFPYLIDETQEVTRTYGATNTPHTFVLNRQSDDSFKIEYIGAIDNNSRSAAQATKHYVQDAVDGLINGSEIKETSTKAIGCTIKWAS
ncbi:MAG: thioredoxin family protein [Cyclobacteriaceae bacterium]